MTPTQRKALQESLAHWEDNVRHAEDNKMFSTGPDYCRCCHIWWNCNCYGCPVYEVTGEFGCKNSPYHEVRKAIQQDGNIIEACRLECDWLKLILDSEVNDES